VAEKFPTGSETPRNIGIRDGDEITVRFDTLESRLWYSKSKQQWYCFFADDIKVIHILTPQVYQQLGNPFWFIFRKLKLWRIIDLRKRWWLFGSIRDLDDSNTD
jgi:hypothetical protein